MRPARWSDLFALFFDPRVPIAFVIGSIALAVAGSAAYAILVDLFGVTRWVQVALLIGSLLIVLFATLTLRQALRFWANRRPPDLLVIPPEQQVDAHGGLIVPVGLRDEGPERPIAEWHLRGSRLRHCWLLVSKEVQGSGKFSDLRQWLQEQNVEVHTVLIADPYSVAVSYAATIEALAAAQVLRGAWPAVVDITGGTAMMSVGIALAAREQGVTIQYYPSRYTADGRVVGRSASAPVLAAFVTGGEEQP
jgi:hypothetical protein